MEQRNSMCIYCRQRLPVLISTTNGTTTNVANFHCPSCKQINSIPTTVIQRSLISSSGSRDPGDYHQANKSACSIGRRIGSKLKIKVSRCNEQSSTKSSLNCNPSPLVSSSDEYPRKRALLIGVSYKKLKYRLKGTINDVANMKHLLTKNFKFKENNILVLTEEEPDELIPTRKNIQIALKWLIDGSKPGDSLVFYFSGHGLRQPDFDGDERDGFDESICPTDFMKEGMILDNDIHSIIVSPLKKGVKLHAIVDSCHSGTVLDLSHVYNRKEREWCDNSPPSGITKTTSGGLAISISACEDNQVAADTSAFTGKTMNGALTYILVDLVKKHPGLTYGDLLDLIHEAIDRLNQGGCLGSAKILRRIFQDKLSQKPMLSSSEMFDVYKTHFSL